jgi:hypothetical protein
MPGWLFQSLVEMMPRIEASEALVSAQAVALGGGNLERAEARKLWNRWERLARHSSEPSMQRASSQREHSQMMESLGFVVKGPGDA